MRGNEIKWNCLFFVHSNWVFPSAKNVILFYAQFYSDFWKYQAMEELWKNKQQPPHIHIYCILYIVQPWRSQEDLPKKTKKNKQQKTSCYCFFLPPLYMIFWVSAPMQSFAFEPAKTSLTVPNPPVTRRAAITLTTAVIEPQPLTVPPAFVLLGAGIETLV